jgi:ribose 5-phosphate isomerase RpiB
MRIALARDPGGFLVGERLPVRLAATGRALSDQGTRSAGSLDCPDFSQAVAEAGAEEGAEGELMISATSLEAA